MPERQPGPVPVMRAATTRERIGDRVRDTYQAIAEQPLGMLADLLGLTNFRGMDERWTNPDAAIEVSPLIGMAAPTRRMPGVRAGGRIPRGSQSGQQTMNTKLPRFRSPLGTFVKHEGQWWRLGKQAADDPTSVTLELLPPASELAGLDGPPPVLDTKVLSADELWQSHLASRGLTEPPAGKLKGRVGPRRRK